MARKFKIKKGDRVTVISGRDRGKQGEVLQVLRQEERLLVQGVNMIKRHTRPSPRHPGGVDPSTTQPTRVGYQFLDDGRKVRFAKRSGEVIDR